jgi:hypothetical protein
MNEDVRGETSRTCFLWEKKFVEELRIYEQASTKFSYATSGIALNSGGKR